MICVQCAAGGGGVLVIFAAVAAIEGLQWLLARIWWITGTAVVIIAAGVALVVLIRRAEERSAERVAIWRAERWPEVGTADAAQIPRAERRAVENHYHVHHHYAGPEPARATAIPGQAGDAITEGK